MDTIANLTRKLNRRERRKQERMTPTKIKEIAKREYLLQRRDEQAESYGTIIALTLLFLNTERGFGKKRLKKFLWDFDDFLEGVKKFGKGNMAEVRKTLLNDCGIDIQEEFKRLHEERGKRNEENQAD